MTKRIIPVSSGKGGVGKTSFAVNLALSLSRYGRCVLVDLDTGTSSVRNTVAAPVGKDLYHFFMKGASLDECITTLPDRLNPMGMFSNFGFVAAPKHMINDIVNLDLGARNRMIDSLNALDAAFIVLDLRAGLDPQVIDFAPQSNTGILVFTPSHPAATLAASDIAKAILFRNLRNLFGVNSELYRHFEGIDPHEVNRMIDMAENPYMEGLPHLDALVMALHRRHPNHPFVNMIYHLVRRFQLFYVLNRFDGVENSFETAVKPLISNINEHLSSRIEVTNLGWVIESEAYHQANTRGVPYLISQATSKVEPKRGAVDRKMDELYALAGIKKKRREIPLGEQGPATESVLAEQLSAMQNMYDKRHRETVAQNLDYITSTLRYTLTHKKPSEFGTPRILKSEELVPRLLARKARRRN